MDIEIRTPLAHRSCASLHPSAVSEKGQLQQSVQSGTFSATLKDAAQNISREKASEYSESDDPIEPIPSPDAEKQPGIALVIGGTLVPTSHALDLQVVSSPEDGHVERTQNSQRSSLPGIESGLSLPQSVSQVEIQGTGAEGQAGAVSEAVLSTSTDGRSGSVLDTIVPGQSGDASSMTPRQTISRTTGESRVGNGPVAQADLSSDSLNQSPALSLAPSTMPQDSPISDQETIPLMEHQGARNVLAAAYTNGGGQSLERPGTGIPPSAVIQEQEAEETTLLGQPLTIPVVGDSEARGQDPFGSDAQGRNGEAFFHVMDSGALELATHDNQSSIFNGQFASARQAQSSIGGERAPGLTPQVDQLKTAQALLGEAHAENVISASGKAQTVHVQLPSHDSGPLSVRISMTDQTVHTQFTTDRNELGALLFTRQDQLQHNLAKSGLDLGQFQVHIDQQGRQEALPDRQSRRNGGGFEQQPGPQDQNQQAQDRERPTHRPSRALSLFA
ncbi:MAG: flagellar hook-length control protein FliK [Nitrospirales bacterium]